MKRILVLAALLFCMVFTLAAEDYSIDSLMGISTSTAYEYFGSPCSINVTNNNSKKSPYIWDSFVITSKQAGNDIEFIYDDFILTFSRTDVIVAGTVLDELKDYTLSGVTILTPESCIKTAEGLMVGDDVVTILTSKGAPRQYEESLILYEDIQQNNPPSDWSIEYYVSSISKKCCFYLENGIVTEIRISDLYTISIHADSGR